MVVFIPQYVVLPSCMEGHATPQVSVQSARDYDLQAPTSPRIHSLPLPEESLLASDIEAVDLQHVDRYPLDISSDLTLDQRLYLQTVKLPTPVHVHVVDTHIGVIITDSVGQTIITALDVVLLLHSVAVVPLDHHSMFSHLPQEMKERVKDAFYRRNALAQQHDRSNSAWSRFIAGQTDADGPLGVDAFFRNGELWGFESCSLGGCSVVHLAGDSLTSL